MNAIEVSNLQRVFKTHTGVIKRTAKEVRAVEDVSFEIPEGELFGLLGPNGAGKTTTMRILAGFLPATSGTVNEAVIAPLDRGAVAVAGVAEESPVGHLVVGELLTDLLRGGKHLHPQRAARGVGAA